MTGENVRRSGSRHRTAGVCAGVTAAMAVAAALIAPQAHADGGAERATAAEVANSVITHTVQRDRDLGSYWTDERIRSAESLDPPQPEPAEAAKAAPRSGSLDAPGQRPRTREAVAPAGRGAKRSVPYAAGGGQADRFGGQGEFPARAVGKLVLRAHGEDAQCTASVIVSDNKLTVWTAAHCVREAGPGGDWYTDFAFIPDADNGKIPHGFWEADRIALSKGWNYWEDEDLQHQVDFAGITLEADPNLGNVQDAVGALGYKFGYGQDFDDVSELGYPRYGYQRDDFTGDDLWFCSGDTSDASWNPFDERLETVCDMGAGASGGPWIDGLDDGHAYIVGVTSTRNAKKQEPGEPPEYTDEYLYSADHGTPAINVYDSAARK